MITSTNGAARTAPPPAPPPPRPSQAAATDGDGDHDGDRGAAPTASTAGGLNSIGAVLQSVLADQDCDAA